ncbi:MAG: prolyl oligopeptidase family serine peptidase [Clostridia bacterium]|nr:prolyl oligopeptidase family serine peptidase [Clostridia bacterium]
MKKYPVLLLGLVCAVLLCALPIMAYPEPAVKEVYVNDSLDGYEMPYNLILPENYDASKSYPVILLLHGAGERGNDNELQMFHAVDELYETRPQLLAETIFLAPQCPEGEQWVDWPWTDGNYSTDEIPESKALSTAIKLLGEILDNYACDRDRVYIIGISMGGYGAWDALVRHEELFAAGVPLCGGGDASKVDILKEIPIWCVHGTADSAVQFAGTEGMVNAIQDAGGERITFTAVEGADHNIWDIATTNGDLIDWLFSQNLTLRYPHEVETEAVTTDAAEEVTGDTADTETDSDAESGGSTAIVLAVVAILLISAGAVGVMKKKNTK